MKLSLVSVDLFKKLNSTNTLLQIRNKNVLENVNIKTLSSNQKIFDELEQDVFKNSKTGNWRKVGKVQLEKRSTGKLVPVDIERLATSQDSGPVFLRLVHNNMPLIESSCKKSTKLRTEVGFEIDQIFKENGADDYKHLAQIMDILAVKEAEKNNLNKILLETNLRGPFISAEPLHWKRGFKRLEYFKEFTPEKKQKYDNRMQEMISAYVKARKEGKSIQEAKKAMNDQHSWNEIMLLPNELVENYKIEAKRIRYA